MNTNIQTIKIENAQTITVNSKLQEKEINPSTESQVILPDSDYDGFSKVNVNPVDNSIDNNIIPNNIKNGITILGVTGNLVEYELPTVQDEILEFKNDVVVEGDELDL